MTLAIGNRQLIFSLVTHRRESTADRPPVADPRSEMRLAQLQARQAAQLERHHWVSNAAMCGAGHLR